jgi:hypothetical protein
MRQLMLLVGWMFFCQSARAQLFSADELLQFISYPTKKFDQYITKRGFVFSGHFLQRDSVVDSWDLLPNPLDSLNPQVHRRILRYQTGSQTHFSLQTSLLAEILPTIEELRLAGFTVSDSNWTMERPLLLQKREWLVQAEKIVEDSLGYVLLRWRRQPMPQTSKVLYAEDLLLFHSDEYLAAYFGRENVRKDQFYFSEQELRRCSILFPNTPRQAVFVWQDDNTMIGIEQLMIGGGVRTESNAGYTGVVGDNGWRLKNGIQTYMVLEQLVDRAGADLSFFGRRSDFFLSLTPESARLIDLQNAALVLECINCSGSNTLDKPRITALEASREGLRLHVGMIVLWPGESHRKLSTFPTVE